MLSLRVTTDSPLDSRPRGAIFMPPRPCSRKVVSETEGPGWPLVGAPGIIADSDGHIRVTAGRRVGRHAQIMPVLHSTADHINTARAWSERETRCL